MKALKFSNMKATKICLKWLKSARNVKPFLVPVQCPLRPSLSILTFGGVSETDHMTPNAKTAGIIRPGH